eukprot:1126262-Ditylum_brightwellii.AAC.1
MAHNSRHISAHNWIARVTKLNNYLTEFPSPPRVELRKMDWEEILEVLENGFPMLWKFQMDKEPYKQSMEEYDITMTYNKG